MHTTPLPTDHPAIIFAAANEHLVRRWGARLVVGGLVTTAALFAAATHPLWSAA